MKRLAIVAVVALVAVGLMRVGPLRAAPGKPLQFYFVDVEGGAATLIVTPAGESVLIDCGWPGFDDRDPKRIQKAAKLAGVSRIDHCISTHWHVDHYGGIAGLSRLLPIRHFYNRGIPDTLEEDKENFPTLIAAYRKASGGKSTTLKPGDRVPLESEGGQRVTLRCLAGNREVIAAGKEDLPENRDCAAAQPQPNDPSDNARSLAFLLQFGDFRFLDCGDLTWNIEQKLVCPVNLIGKIDLFQVTHHGSDQSNNPVLVRSIHPRVAVIDNGPHKGGSASVFATLKSTPGLESIYQLHRNVETTARDNTSPEFIANVDEQCEGRFIKAEVAPDGRRYTLTLEGQSGSRSFATR